MQKFSVLAWLPKRPKMQNSFNAGLVIQTGVLQYVPTAAGFRNKKAMRTCFLLGVTFILLQSLGVAKISKSVHQGGEQSRGWILIMEFLANFYCLFQRCIDLGTALGDMLSQIYCKLCELYYCQNLARTCRGGFSTKQTNQQFFQFLGLEL